MSEQSPVAAINQSARLLSFEVGQRVRTLRRTHGITRRQLAEATAISERYLGQLENGQANASIHILHKIANHFGENRSRADPGRQRLCIGPPAAG